MAIITSIQGSANSQDDIVVWEENLSEHDDFLRKVLIKVRESGLKPNKNKCQFRKKSIVFLGHIISSEDIRFDASKTETITKMPVPQFLTELQRFLRMVNCLSKFILNVAEVTTTLRGLLKKGVVFNLQKPQLDAIEKLETLIVSAPILKIFDPNLPTKLKIDASSEGLGAHLGQNHGSLEIPQWYLIGYSSCVLRDNEKRYAQIEKRDSFYSFWSRTFPRTFIWSKIYHQ